MPKADLIRLPAIEKIVPCEHFHIDAIKSLGEQGWAAHDWISQSHSLRAPEWILVFDSDNRLLDFMRPYVKRQNVVSALKTSHFFRGFTAPIARQMEEHPTGIWLMAVFNRGRGSCKMPAQSALP